MLIFLILRSVRRSKFRFQERRALPLQRKHPEYQRLCCFLAGLLEAGRSNTFATPGLEGLERCFGSVAISQVENEQILRRAGIALLSCCTDNFRDRRLKENRLAAATKVQAPRKPQLRTVATLLVLKDCDACSSSRASSDPDFWA